MNDIEWSYFYLIINALLWTITFVIVQRKTRYFGVGNAIIMLYTIISVLAINLYDHSIYIYGNLKLLPFIYLFAMIMLACYPILSLQRRGVDRIIQPNHRLFNTVCIFIIIFAFVSLPRTVTLIKENLISLILDSTMGAELYGKSSMAQISKSTSGFNIIPIIGGVCGNIAIVFFMYYLTIEKKNKILLWGLGISSLIGPLASVANGGRFMLATFIFNSTYLFIFIYRFISLPLRKKITRFFVVFGCILLIPFVALTLSRNKGDSEMAINMAEDYLSQGILNFNNYGLDAGGTRQGDYTAVVFKYVAQMQPAMYYNGRISKYWRMKLNESTFYTFVGDFTLDYGPIIALVLFIIIAPLSKFIIKPRQGAISFQQYLIVYILIVTCIGYFQFTLGREEGNLNLIALLILAFCFKLANDIDKRKAKSIE